MRQPYAGPTLTALGTVAEFTRADLTSAVTDVYYGPDGTDVNPGGLTGSGPGCIDSNPKNGVCDYEDNGIVIP